MKAYVEISKSVNIAILWRFYDCMDHRTTLNPSCSRLCRARKQFSTHAPRHTPTPPFAKSKRNGEKKKREKPRRLWTHWHIRTAHKLSAMHLGEVSILRHVSYSVHLYCHIYMYSICRKAGDLNSDQLRVRFMARMRAASEV